MIISVHHTFANGWHEFSCPQVPGFHLLAEDSDLKAAFEQVPGAIAEIVEADEGFGVEVKLQHTYSEYLKRLPAGFQSATKHYSIEKRAA